MLVVMSTGLCKEVVNHFCRAPETNITQYVN